MKQELQQYLLGTLPDERMVAIEDRAFSEPEFLAEIESAEADLIDAFVRGELAPADRRQFEFLFLASPRRRAKVELARSLARAADAYAPSRPRESAWPWWPRLATAFAGLALVGGIGWLASDRRGLRTQVAQLASQVEVLRSAPVASRPSPPPIASLVLLPGVSRGESRAARLVMDPQAQLARLEVHLDARDEHPRYRAELRSGGGEVMSWSALRGRPAPGGIAVVIELPASTLVAGDYELALKAGRSAIGYYYFTVQR